MPFRANSVSLETHGDREFRLIEPVIYVGKSQTFTVPAGFVTDFASVPAAVSWLIPSYGKYTLAAIVHDYLCVALGDDFKRGIPSFVSSRDTDAIFRRIMRELGVPFLRRWIMWTGVRWGAMINPARRKGISKDLLPVLLWSILAAPLVVPASLIVGIGLLIDKVFEALFGRLLK